MIEADVHVHTEISSDCVASIESMIESALAKGLKAMCITDHQDIEYPVKGEFQFDTDVYFKVLQQYKEKYAEKIDVRIGVEIGLQPHLGAFYQQYAKSYSFDFIIGSIHVVEGYDPYYPEFFEKYEDKEGYRRAFRESISCLKQVQDFDVLGHIDYIVRYGKEKAVQYSYKMFADEIDEILRLIIEKGKGIEINTSGLRYGLGFTHPHIDVIKRYKELGGEVITVGADAHKPEDVGSYFNETSQILRQAGFEYYTEFQKREPVFKKI